MPVQIREWDPGRDLPGVRSCFVELQDEEHAVYPTSPAGEQIADEYLDWMQSKVAEYDGRIWVAEEAEHVVGFVTVLAQIPRSDPDDGDAVHAQISEITLRPTYRGTGLGAQLLAQAEDYARSRGAASVRIGHHGKNHGAHRFYERAGYETIAVFVEKRL